MNSKKKPVVKSEKAQPKKRTAQVASPQPGFPLDGAEHTQSEQALRESERKFRETITYLDEGYYHCTMEGVLLDHNRAFNRMLGFEVSQDLKGRKLPDFWQNPDDRKGYVSELMTGGVVSNYLINAKTTSGDKIVVMANSHLVKDGKGTPVGIEGTFTNMTDSKRMENALKESEAKYRALFENAQIGIYRTRLDGSAFLEVNEKFGEILGFSPQELLGSPGRIRWANPENRDKMLKQLQEQGGVLTNYEVQVIAKNGEVKDVLASIELVPGEGYIEGTMTDITGRVQIEEALRQSENTVLAWLNAIQESAFLMDREGLILAANATTAQRLNRSVEELVGACIYDFIPPRIAQSRRQHIAQVIESGQPVHFEDERFGRVINNLIYPVFDNSGQVKYMAILGTDITERKQADQQLKEREALLNEVGVIAKLGGWEMDITTGKATWSKGTYDIVEIDYDKPVPGLHEHIGYYLPEYREMIESKMNALIETKQPMKFEAVLKTAKGNIKWCQALGEAVVEDGKLIKLRGTFQDITERKQAEEEILRLNAGLEQRVADRTAQLQTANRQLENELAERKNVEVALRESEERFRRLSEAAFEAINIHDKGVLLSANSQFSEMFGYELEELLGKQVMPLTIAPEAIEAVKKEIATGGVGPYESTGLRKDGTRFPMEIRVRELEYKGRKVRVAAIMDITERERAVEALQHRTTQLEAANQELEAFSYSISHDLRSPLRAMDGFSRILLEDYAPQLPAEAQRYLNLVRDNAKQMGHLIEDLLAFSRLSRLPLNKQTVAMAEVVQRALAELSAEQRGRNVEVMIGDLPVCEADPALLKQVWVNLLSNAFKFTRKREDAHIEIDAKQTGAECIYFIKDNGVGFDMQYVDKLFGVFQRLHRSEEYEGTGVGLAIVQRIVHRHGGGAWAEAEVDKGATFYFTI